jgi:HPt (histidine-containing phosphotransfer) domain-containing protein
VTDGKSIDRSLAILDPQPIEEAFGAIDEMAIETYGLFVSTTEPLLAEIGRHLAAGDLSAASETAHSAKGAARMSGAFRLAAVCAAIETLTRQGNADDALEWLALVPDAFEEVRQAIHTVETTGVFPRIGG